MMLEIQVLACDRHKKVVSIGDLMIANWVNWRRYNTIMSRVNLICDHPICYFNCGIDTVTITPLHRQLMSWNFKIQYSYLHSNVIMCIATLMTRWRKRNQFFNNLQLYHLVNSKLFKPHILM
jgi:hypothetical protein